MELGELKNRVLRRLRPSVEERRRVEEVVKLVEERALEEARRLGVDLEVSVEGSIAKDTWISGDKDVDVFLKLPRELGRRGLEEVGLKIARAAAGGDYIESYAEHPYIQAFISGYRVDIVPCYRLDRLEGEVTAVDRTPFHTAFIKSRLDERLKDEVRLLKGFMKGCGVYGAEIKVQGFSGYLCELLVLSYGGFEEALRAASEWRPGEVVLDPAGHYHDLEEPRRLFNQPLVVVDPVDARRNVAAALSLQKMAEFSAASRLFLAKPSELFFHPPPPRALTREALGKALEERGTHLAALEVPVARMAPDILWGQLHKSLEGLETLLLNEGFEVLDKGAWSDEERVAVFTFELAHVKLPRLKRQLGPPPQLGEHESKFLLRHLGRDLKGPRLEGWRWVSYPSRRLVDVAEVLMREGARARLGRAVAEGLRKGRVYVDVEVAELLDKYEGYREHLSELLDGRPRWLRAYEEASRG